MDPVQTLACAAVGFVAGLLGGLAGVGGSMVILPALGIILGYPTHGAQHLYMAAAMTVNFAVAVPAAAKHRRAGAVRTDLLPVLIASTLVFMAAGVGLSNLFTGEWLKRLLGTFLFGYCALNMTRLVRPRRGDGPRAEHTNPPRLLFSGASTGLVGGLLGLGGGVMLVPLLQVLCGVRLRESIATSSAVICITAILGAGAKLATLDVHDESWSAALLLAGIMAPGAMLGAPLGAALTHRLPVVAVRVAVTILVGLASLRLAGMAG